MATIEAHKKDYEVQDTLTVSRRKLSGTQSSFGFCRILGDLIEGDLEKEATLKRDLSWWVDDLIAEQSDDCESLNAEAPNPKGATKVNWRGSKAREGCRLIIGFNGHKEQCESLTIIATS